VLATAIVHGQRTTVHTPFDHAGHSTVYSQQKQLLLKGCMHLHAQSGNQMLCWPEYNRACEVKMHRRLSWR
jgi:hypothetical protein